MECASLDYGDELLAKSKITQEEYDQKYAQAEQIINQYKARKTINKKQY